MSRDNSLPTGDVVAAADALSRIDQALERQRVAPQSTKFRISGTSTEVGRADAERWIGDALADGYDTLRYIIHQTGGSAIVEIAVSSSLKNAAEDE